VSLPGRSSRLASRSTGTSHRAPPPREPNPFALCSSVPPCSSLRSDLRRIWVRTSRRGEGFGIGPMSTLKGLPWEGSSPDAIPRVRQKVFVHAATRPCRNRSVVLAYAPCE
jgi:hypothetical protein